jgi:hypothetical protein
MRFEADSEGRLAQIRDELAAVMAAEGVVVPELG